jgi:hypothetical protein
VGDGRLWKIHAMLKRLISGSLSAVLRHAVDSDTPVCPPLVRAGSPRPRSGWSGWISSISPTGPVARMERGGNDSHFANDPLNRVRLDFIEAVSDVQTPQSGDTLRRIRIARSLRELWFLRTDVFNAVAQQHSQSEASQRLARLGEHFPRQVARGTVPGRLRSSQV